MNTTRTLGAFTTIILLALTGCGAESENSTPQTTPQTTPITVLTQNTDPAPPSTAPQSPAMSLTTSSSRSAVTLPTRPRASTTTPTQIPPWDELPPDPRGSQVTLAGEQATICLYGDGWGTNVWAANANTSCEFVIAVQNALTTDLNPTYDNIRLFLRSQITVTSPVTGQTYNLTCSQRDANLMACTGGNNAVVYFY